MACAPRATLVAISSRWSCMASQLQAGSTRAGTLPGPAIGELVLLAHPHLVLKPDLYRCAGCKLRADFLHTLGEVFLNASMASAFCLWALGRALICEKPNFLRAR